MALVPVYHVVADYYPVDPDWPGLTDPDVVAGTFVTLTVDGFATVCDGTTDRCIGVAGDTQSNTTSGTPYAAQVIINGAGAQRWTENRVSDYFNETLASGKLTVYNSGGKFKTNLFESTIDALTTPHVLYVSANGFLTNADAGNGQIVGDLVEAVNPLDSGVPGTDTANGSISLGDYVTFKLNI